MKPALGSYELHADGWRWHYELFPDKLIATGVAGDEHQHFEFELTHAHEVPHRGVTVLGVQYPMVFLIENAAAMLLTIAIFGTWFLFRPIPVHEAPWPENKDLAFLCLATLALELSAAILLPHVCRWRSLQRYVIFKRISDGGELLRLHSRVNPADDAFERFVDEVIAGIRLQRLVETPADYSFKAYEDHSGA